MMVIWIKVVAVEWGDSLDVLIVWMENVRKTREGNNSAKISEE